MSESGSLITLGKLRLHAFALGYPRKNEMPQFQKYYRKAQAATFPPLRLLYRVLFRLTRNSHLVDLSIDCDIGGGLYLGHPHCITINPSARIGQNVNIHKGVTIGQENRGARKGVPTIGNNVWIGVNATIVGNIIIGDDVLIAPNTYVNCNIPSHCVVLGNPCQIKPNAHATEGYVNRTVPFYEQGETV